MKFAPTFLYIKQHTITGKYYFGKTTKRDPVGYLGSGTHWRAHIKKHGREHVKTIWYKLFTEKEDCIEFATFASTELDIVKSSKWLNIIAENGIDGIVTGYKFSKDVCIKRSIAQTGKSRGRGRICGSPSIETREKISAANINKKKSSDHCNNISKGMLGKMRGPYKTSCMRITNGVDCKMIKQLTPIPTGWKRGRQVINRNLFKKEST